MEECFVVQSHLVVKMLLVLHFAFLTIQSHRGLLVHRERRRIVLVLLAPYRSPSYNRSEQKLNRRLHHICSLICLHVLLLKLPLHRERSLDNYVLSLVTYRGVKRVLQFVHYLHTISSASSDTLFHFVLIYFLRKRFLL